MGKADVEKLIGEGNLRQQYLLLSGGIIFLKQHIKIKRFCSIFVIIFM